MKRRRLVATIRFAALVLLVATPALARPPHAPEDQYLPFIESTPVIEDAKTSLAWERQVAPTDTWENADIACRLRFGGRLPTIKELLTIFDEDPHDEYFGKLVSVHVDPDAFGRRTPVDAPYWTSTPGKNSETQVWALDFSTGEMTEHAKLSTTDSLRYRCVKQKQ